MSLEYVSVGAEDYTRENEKTNQTKKNNNHQHITEVLFGDLQCKTEEKGRQTDTASPNSERATFMGAISIQESKQGS